MAVSDGEARLLPDFDVDGLARQFLDSDYAGGGYATRSLDQCLHDFLRRNGLIRIADDGDVFNIIFTRVMTSISALDRTAEQSPAARTHPRIADSTR